MKASKVLTVSVSIFRGWILWCFSFSKNNSSPAAPDLELILFPLWYWPIMNAHTKQQQDKVFEMDCIDSQKSNPPFAHLLALSIYTYICIYIYMCVMCVCVWVHMCVCVHLSHSYESLLMCTLCVSLLLNCWWHFPSHYVHYVCYCYIMLVQRFETQDRCFTNFHYYY